MRGPGVEYQPVPGLDGVRVGTDGSVWVDLTRPGLPPPWNVSRWKRLAPFKVAGTGAYVRVRIGGRSVVRSVELLCRAAAEGDPRGLVVRERSKAGAKEPAAIRPAYPLTATPAVRPPEPDPPPVVIPPIPPDAGELDGRELLPRKGTDNGRARLDDAKVIEARRLWREGWSYVALAGRYGISECAVSYACRGKTWSHVRE